MGDTGDQTANGLALPAPQPVSAITPPVTLSMPKIEDRHWGYIAGGALLAIVIVYAIIYIIKSGSSSGGSAVQGMKKRRQAARSKRSRREGVNDAIKNATGTQMAINATNISDFTYNNPRSSGSYPVNLPLHNPGNASINHPALGGARH